MEVRPVSPEGTIQQRNEDCSKKLGLYTEVNQPLSGLRKY